MKKNVHKRGKKQEERPVFGAIRKPVAPPGHPLGQARADERAHPARRKAKHKSRVQEADTERDD